MQPHHLYQSIISKLMILSCWLLVLPVLSNISTKSDKSDWILTSSLCSTPVWATPRTSRRSYRDRPKLSERQIRRLTPKLRRMHIRLKHQFKRAKQILSDPHGNTKRTSQLNQLMKSLN